MANFETALKVVINYEGGYVNDPVDKGGETYKGIARNFSKNWAGWAVIDNYKKRNGVIKRGTVLNDAVLDKMVSDFYFVNKWMPSNAAYIQNQTVANFVFDMYVNHGKAGVLVNQAVNAASGQKVLQETNSITQDTIRQINANPANIYQSLIQVRTNYFKSLDTFWKFGTGWLARITKFPSNISVSSNNDVQKKK